MKCYYLVFQFLGSPWEPGEQIPAVTGAFVMDFPCRVTSIIPDSVYTYTTMTPSSRGTLVLGDQFGGRGRGDVNNLSRGYDNPIPFRDPSRSFFFPSASSDSLPMGPIQSYKRSGYDIHSPYIIFPDDKLIFGWQYPLTINMQSGFSTGSDSLTNSMELYGNSQLTMFGSQIRDKIEFHDTLNQHLTTECVSEDIGYDQSLCRDQFLINTRYNTS